MIIKVITLRSSRISYKLLYLLPCLLLVYLWISTRVGLPNMWICCKLSLQPVHISLKVKNTNLVMEVRYNLLGISPNRCGKWWETHHQFHYIHQSLISSFYYSILQWSPWCTQLEYNLVLSKDRIKPTRHKLTTSI